MRAKLTAIDLFSGCGGLSWGLKQAGFKVIAAVEKDELAANAYRLNHPKTHLWRTDIRRLTAPAIMEELRLTPGKLDLLAGCPPCQGFSALRTRNGHRKVLDARNELIMDFARLVKGLQPKAVMLENVPGLYDDPRLDKLFDALTSMGYSVTVSVEDAQDYGVPQRRKRLLLLAGFGNGIPLARRARRRRTVRETIGDLPAPGRSGDPLHDLSERRSARITKLIKSIPHDGGSRTDLPNSLQLRCHKACDGFKDVYGRMSWDTVAPTITGGCFNPSKGRFLHPTQNRAITLREAALLQSFPRSYRFPSPVSKERAALLIGNALPPEFSRRHALQIKKFILSHGTSTR